MGGQFNYWGLWLDCEYGHGECSESCTTFKNYCQLSVNKQFEIRNIEVWAVGEKPKNEDVSDYHIKWLLINKSPYLHFSFNFFNFLSTFNQLIISQEEELRDSILEGHLEDKAVLEMAGRGRYSEGYRDDKPSDLEFQNWDKTMPHFIIFVYT